jgi:transcriptional regulator with XRE-family HTH domain
VPNAWFYTLNAYQAFVKQNASYDGANVTDRTPTQSTRHKAPHAIIAAALRRERDRAELSLSEVAKRAGVAKSTLHQLEAGTGNPSIETLWALAVALNVPFSRLVEPPPTHAPTVIRAGEATVVLSEEADYVGALLSTCPPGARRDLYLITAEPGRPRRAAAHLIGSVEHIVVISGRLRTGPVESTVDLEPRDYASFSAEVPHVYEALASGTSFVLLMEHR